MRDSQRSFPILVLGGSGAVLAEVHQPEAEEGQKRLKEGCRFSEIGGVHFFLYLFQVGPQGQRKDKDATPLVSLSSFGSQFRSVGAVRARILHPCQERARVRNKNRGAAIMERSDRQSLHKDRVIT